VQTTLRMAASAPSRQEPDYAAFTLANLVFGGYFSSRWVANIREDKGYTYSPHAQVEHPPAGSRVSISADVSTPTTAPALLETLYELGRVATTPVGQGELDQARRYAVGTLALGTSTQAGLASTLSQLAGAGLGIGYLRDYPQQLAAAVPAERSAAWAELDVSVLHAYLVPALWGLPDDVEHVGYEHDVDGTLAAAFRTGGTAVLLNPTPVDAVARVAGSGERMPRKSTFFTPKPRTGMVVRDHRDA